VPVFSPDGRWLASAQYDSRSPEFGKVLIFDFATGKEVHNVAGPTPYIRAIFAADSQHLALVPVEGHQVVRLWRLPASFAASPTVTK
jgi:hypothetical protein